jgi:predicted membrane protein
VSSRTSVDPVRHPLHLASLLAALLIMLTGTFYPPLLIGQPSGPDHLFLTLLLLGMSVGFVRGVGLVPAQKLWRWMFSGWTCALLLLLAGVVRFLH